MKRNRFSWVAVAAILFVLTMGALSAEADPIVFNLTSDHCSGTGGCLGSNTSVGTITLNNTTGGVTAEISLISGVLFMNSGIPATFVFNLSGTPTITGSANPNDFTLISGTAGSISMPGTLGDFEYGFTANFGQGTGNAKAGPYTFTILGTDVTTSSFVQNSAGQYFVVDVSNTITGNTGAVDASQASVPDGGITVMLLGGALVGLETLRRKFRVGR